MAQRRISDDQFKELLLDELRKGIDGIGHERTKFYKTLQNDFSLDNTRAAKLYDKYFAEWSELNNKALNDTIVQEVKESAIESLKTKHLHIVELEALLEPDYRVDDVSVYMGVPVEYQRRLNPSEIVKIKAEIAKWRGLYEPTKVAETKVDGTDVENKPDIAKLPKETLLQLLETYK